MSLSGAFNVGPIPTPKLAAKKLPSIPPPKFLPGDIVLDGVHTMMIVAEVRGYKYVIAHAVPMWGVVIEDTTPAECNLLSSTEVFRCTRAPLRLLAAEFARSWAVPHPKDSDVEGTTEYSTTRDGDIYTDRGKGTWAKRGGSPPFEYDAMYRAFKWARRFGRTFSETRGTTCCAFVTACYQAAAIKQWALQGTNDAIVAEHRLQEMADFLGRNRGDKKTLPQVPYTLSGKSNTKIGLKPQREWSNRETILSDPSFAAEDGRTYGFDELWTFVVGEVSRPEGRDSGRVGTPAEVLTQAMVVDAKYSYSANLLEMLRTDPEWEKKGEVHL